MSELDETDLEILRLLIEDARRPYSDVAERVDRSPPTVSDRIDRLVELGVIERFTVEVDRGVLSGGVPVLVEMQAKPGQADDIRDALESLAVVEHVFATVDARVLATGRVEDGEIETALLDRLDPDGIVEYDVRVLAGESWNPLPPDVSLAIECDECGNTVTSEGESTRLDGRTYHFCCPSCRSRFEDRYEELAEAPGE